jgi:hypothetical protein
MKKQYFIFIILLSLGLSGFAQHPIPYRKGNKWGYCDSNKNILITPQYDYVERFTKQGIAKVIRNGKHGYINTAGKEIIVCKYRKSGYFYYNRTFAWLDDKAGLIDTNGAEIIPFIYDSILFNPSSPQLIAVHQNGKWGFYNANGKLLVPPTFEDAQHTHQGFAAIMQGNKWGFVDSLGKVVITPRYGNVDYFVDGLCAVMVEGKWGFINTKGYYTVKPAYRRLYHFQNQGAWAQNHEEKWGLIDTTGKVVIPFIYDRASYFKEGLAYVELNKKWGYIDSLGNTVLPFVYYQAFEFKYGLAHVCFGEDSCGYINKAGETVIPFEYEINFGGEFYEGLAEVRKNNLCGFINTKNEIVIPIKYKSPYDYNNMDNGLGELLLPTEGNNDDNIAKRLFYFNRHGTLFFD